LVVGLGLPVLATAATAAPAPGTAAKCSPVIKHVTQFNSGKTPGVTITGTCFGTGGAYMNGNSKHFRVTDLGPHGTIAQLLKIEKGTLPQNGWNACASFTDNINQHNPDVVTCDVPKWSNTSVTFSAFGRDYGAESSWVVNAGDKVIIQIWNVQSLRGPSLYLVTAAR
jgi:hypothetical protein